MGSVESPTVMERRHEEQLAFVRQLVSQIQLLKWYGTVEFRIEGGIIQQAFKKESIIPPGK